MNRLLIEIFKTFSEAELKSFGEFIISPYFKKKSAVIKFWNVVSAYAPEFSSEVKREDIYSKIFPGKKYNYGTMKNLIFELSRLIEKFLSVEKLNNDKFQSDLYYLNQLLDRSLGKVFNSKFSEIEKQCKKVNGEYQEYYLNLSRLTALKKDFQFIQSLKEIDYHDFDKTSEYLIYYLIVQIFAEYNSSTAIRIMANKSGAAHLLEKLLDSLDLEKVMSAIKDQSIEDYDRLVFSYKKYLAIANPDKPAFYFEFKSHIIKNMEILTRDEKYNVINGLITALSELQIDSYQKTREYTELNKLRVKHNLVVAKEGLSPVIYSSIIYNAGITKDSEFLKEFMDKYYDELQEDYKVNMKNLSLAYLSFAKNEFHQSLEYINKIDFDIFQFKLYVRNLQMMVYYEIGDYIGFSYTKDAYKHFLINNKSISQRTKLLYNNLINYIESLFQVRDSRDFNDTEILKVKLINENVVGMKSWLLEKAGELS